ncbi:MAG: TRAP transporter substrate-binding protein [Desulfarculaceae bacterium]|nr:TRAP transporter substrate-binding protein [Desulfarculaceae bacterium]MCF8073215.1 TRAP transporter substrate-binding protein [Desulfarculaceae bacterium]MCF8100811.1 TRAP transporter substrate-binding protein [Desulfarculaceae bacterium]MCF8117751.1 TRAP transporter substrate-binding protein [Desulfarculaceae bacterium]
MNRRDFLKKAGVGAAAATAATAVNAPFVHARPKVRWKMVTTWPPNLPYLQDAAEYMAKLVEQMSGGAFKIKVYAAGELVPALQTFEAVRQGSTVQAGSSVAYYQAGKAPAAQWFAAVPFGLNCLGMSAWFYSGGGLKLWEETYAPFGVLPRPGGSTGVQMGGWFNKKIETIKDFKGLKMRIPGLGGKVVARAGATVTLVPGGEIFTNMERGVIDATEWVGPLHDKIMGFYKVAKYYYYPGWHEPGAFVEYIFNQKAVDKLPAEYKSILDAACAQAGAWTTQGFNAANGQALRDLIFKKKVKLMRFPDPVLAQLKVYSKEALAEIAAENPQAKKVNDSYQKFSAVVGTWGEISEKPYYNAIADKYPLAG